MPRPNSDRDSISLDREIVDFIRTYIKEHRGERLRQGKDTTIVSIVREGLFLWAEKHGVLEELLEHLELKE